MICFVNALAIGGIVYRNTVCFLALPSPTVIRRGSSRELRAGSTRASLQVPQDHIRSLISMPGRQCGIDRAELPDDILIFGLPRPADTTAFFAQSDAFLVDEGAVRRSHRWKIYFISWV